MSPPVGYLVRLHHFILLKMELELRCLPVYLFGFSSNSMISLVLLGEESLWWKNLKVKKKVL